MQNSIYRNKVFRSNISAYNFDSQSSHFVDELEGSCLTNLVFYLPDKCLYS